MQPIKNVVIGVGLTVAHQGFTRINEVRIWHLRNERLNRRIDRNRFIPDSPAQRRWRDRNVLNGHIRMLFPQSRHHGCKPGGHRIN